MSTLKADTLQAKTTNGTLTLTNNGTGKVELPADATIGGVAMATTFASGATTAEKSNIMLNSFRIEEQGGLTIQGMVDGISDVFTDESGVDTSASTDESYNATNDYYENLGAQTQISQGAGTVFGGALSGGALANLFDGNTNQSYGAGAYWSTNSVGYVGKYWGAGTPKTVSGFKAWGTNNYGFVNNTNPTVTLTLYGSNSSPANATDGTSLGSMAFTDANSYAASKLTGITTTTAYEYHWVTISFVDAQLPMAAEFEFYETAAAANSVIVSDTFTALSQPDTAFVTVWHEDVDSVTLNTDFTIEVSRDAGTTWTAGTLALATTLGADKIITCTIDISGQPAGTSMEYRAKFLNEKSQRLRGVGLQWS